MAARLDWWQARWHGSPAGGALSCCCCQLFDPTLCLLAPDTNSTTTDYPIMQRNQGQVVYDTQDGFTHNRPWSSSMNSNMTTFSHFSKPMTNRKPAVTRLECWIGWLGVQLGFLWQHAFARVSRDHMNIKKQRCVWPIRTPDSMLQSETLTYQRIYSTMHHFFLQT